MSPSALSVIARRRGRRDETREQLVRRAEARRLAVAIRHAGDELKTNKTQLAELVADLAPGLMGKVGIGQVSAAQAIVSWSHRSRSRNEAAFAALAGAGTLPASSG
jgi:transposase